jgi:hypothetical protein
MVFLAANAHRVHAGTFNSLIRSYSHAGTRGPLLFYLISIYSFSF